MDWLHSFLFGGQASNGGPPPGSGGNQNNAASGEVTLNPKGVSGQVSVTIGGVKINFTSNTTGGTTGGTTNQPPPTTAPDWKTLVGLGLLAFGIVKSVRA